VEAPFGEPALEPSDLLRTDSVGRGRSTSSLPIN
jgi:hypothetical protein